MKKSSTKKINPDALVRPVKPEYPQCSDKVKYPTPPTKEGKNCYGEAIYLPNADYLRDCEQYRKDIVKYERDLYVFEQVKMIKLLKNADINYILKKYKITKID